MGNNFSLLSLFTGGDLMTLFVSIALLAASIYSWYIIIEKFRMWRADSKTPVKIKRADSDVMKLEIDKILKSFDKNLWFLSLVAYVSPFIGLFGTIWGVMDSFASIGVNQSVSIGVIAPGLATALGTTALALIAAIPAAIAYRYFIKKSDDLYDRLEHFRKESK